MGTLDATPVSDYTSGLRLDGRGFVVVGAGNGMGRQSAHALAANGAKVICVDIDPERAAAVATEIDGVAYSCDVRVAADVEKLIAFAGARVDLYGVVDVVGLHAIGALIDTPEDNWDWCFDMTLRHAYHLIRFGGRALSDKGRGTMVFVSSVNGISSAPSTGAYGAAKAALNSLVRTAAVELKSREVRVNAVAPGLIVTPRVLARPPRSDNENDTGSLSQKGATKDVANAILFLASDMAAYITGQTIVVDGGAIVASPFETGTLPAGFSMRDS
ncbi:MAG: SDR family NAD(P)-dependent oxidoreductase [Acidimicrobiia bacterium]